MATTAAAYGLSPDFYTNLPEAERRENFPNKAASAKKLGIPFEAYLRMSPEERIQVAFAPRSERIMRESAEKIGVDVARYAKLSPQQRKNLGRYHREAEEKGLNLVEHLQANGPASAKATLCKLLGIVAQPLPSQSVNKIATTVLLESHHSFHFSISVVPRGVAPKPHATSRPT